MAEKPSEIQFTNMSDDSISIPVCIFSCGIRLKIHSNLRGKNSNFELEAILLKQNVSEVKYPCHIRETFKFSK